MLERISPGIIASSDFMVQDGLPPLPHVWRWLLAGPLSLLVLSSSRKLAQNSSHDAFRVQESEKKSYRDPTVSMLLGYIGQIKSQDKPQFQCGGEISHITKGICTNMGKIYGYL